MQLVERKKSLSMQIVRCAIFINIEIGGVGGCGSKRLQTQTGFFFARTGTQLRREAQVQTVFDCKLPAIELRPPTAMFREAARQTCGSCLVRFSSTLKLGERGMRLQGLQNSDKLFSPAPEPACDAKRKYKPSWTAGFPQ